MKKSVLIVLIIILIAVIIYCNLFNNTAASVTSSLTPIEIIDIKVPEPSGLYYDDNTNTLWTVSDENSTIYNFDLEGKILDSIIVNGFDLEGITIIDDSIFAVILERAREVVFIDKKGNEIDRFSIDIPGKPNKGLEGITFNPKDRSLFVLNEKNSGLLFHLDISGNILDKHKLNYARDFSGIDYEESEGKLWIVSDEDESIYLCTLHGTYQEKYKVNIEQIEGIAVNSKESVLYLISDPLEKLFVFNLP